MGTQAVRNVHCEAFVRLIDLHSRLVPIVVAMVICLALVPLWPNAATAAAANTAPATPVVTEPATDGQVVSPADVHMEQTAFSDPNAGDTHRCTDWEIRITATAEVAWTSYCNSAQLVHVHLGDGVFANSYAGRTALAYDTDYYLRVRDRDSSGDPVTEWSGWGQRAFRTSPQPAPGTSVTWTVRQAGYQVDAFAGGLQLPVDIAFVPNPGANRSDPFFYVTELYGNVKVVSRDGTITDYVRGVLNYKPSGVFPGSGEQGTTGITVDPISGDVFVSMLYESSPGGPKYPKIVRFRSDHNGKLAGSSTTILDMVGEEQRESHQISNLSIGPDGKLYAHNGDGFDYTTGQKLYSFRGKILRMNLDGSPPADNPFYDPALGRAAQNYVFAYGFRNPFGGAWRAADGQHYEVENGPSVDRFAKIVPGRNYLWDGSDASMRNYPIYNWSPAVAPVNMAFVESQTLGGSGFPADKLGHAFIAESGPTYATGPQTLGKRIAEFVLDASGGLVSGPTDLVEYTGMGKASAVGLTAGPDGLYFTELYADGATDPTAVGARVMRIRYVGAGTANVPPTVGITSPASGATYTAPASIAISANAADSDGTIAKVQFFQGTTLLGQSTTAPYTFTWSNVPAGTYSLTAKATDNAGAATTSSAVGVTVTSTTGAAGTFSLSASPGSRSIKTGAGNAS
ncbi:MAG: PQQ-dependent sugar dehydrogenase, partial [Candidatus Limnocylindria bacterium]